MESAPTRRTPSASLVISILALFVALSGSAVALTGRNKVDSNDLRRNVVHTKNIEPGAVKSGKVADETLTADDLAFGSVGAAEIASDAVGTSEIGLNGVDTPEIAFEAVTANEIASNAVGTSKLTSNAVTGSKIQAHAVGNSDLAAGSVSIEKLNGVTGLIEVNFPEIDPWDCDTVTPLASGVTTTDNLIVTANDDFTGFLSWNVRQGSLDGVIFMSACNPTGSAINPPLRVFRYLALHP